MQGVCYLRTVTHTVLNYIRVVQREAATESFHHNFLIEKKLWYQSNTATWARGRAFEGE
jgi:hypothetical protein